MFFRSIQDFVESGGWVLLVLGVVIFLMWGLALERLIYQRWVFPRVLDDALKAWVSRTDRTSWRAQQIQRRLRSELQLALEGPTPLIRTLLALCPLVGLLGTVTGMVEVFDVMAMVGTGNPRSMASGVNRAIIPAMSGMVGAVSGIFVMAWLQRNSRKLRALMEHRLGEE